MNFFTKSFHFIYGFVLFIIYNRRLSFNEIIKGKRVAIIGAANSAYQKNNGQDIDNFDIVIRINKAPHLLKNGKWKDQIGSKADVLFHSFYENEVSGGGPLDLDVYDRLRIRYIVNPINGYGGLRVTFNFYKKYLASRITYRLNRLWYLDTLRQLQGFQPTIGFCALKAALESDFSELFITGFTFFKTPFGEGYRDGLKEVVEIKKFIKDAGLHDPDLEFAMFLKLLDKYRHKKIIMDETLLAIVRSYEK
jgi:hypothetical protein